MKFITYACCAALLACPVSNADDQSTEKELKIHRYATSETAPWDAFEYMNRLAAKPNEGETAKEFAGRIIGNIANVEGRVLVKVPPGWDRQAYDGFKMFFNTNGGIGSANCASCHIPAEFGDGLKHMTPGGAVARTPSLRNLSKSAPYFEDKSAATLEEVIKKKITMAKTAKEEGASAEEDYKNMNITEKDIAPLVAFLKQLEEVDKEKFRPMILSFTILDTAYLWE